MNDSIESQDSVHPDGLRNLDQLGLADSRMQYFAVRDGGTSRPFGQENRYENISRFESRHEVPVDVRIHFDTARNLYLYAWFVYRFHVVAEQHALASLEMALSAVDSHSSHHPTSRRRRQEPPSPGRSSSHQPVRRQSWTGKSPNEILATYKPGKADPEKVLDVLIELFNRLHTSLEKTVSHKTRHDRAQFLRRFFRDLRLKAGFKTMPDPRNLGQKHIRAMVQVWKVERLAPATIQTYLSFLRGLGMWMGKHGFVRSPAYYGLAVDEFQRHEYAQRDKSWSAQGIDIDALINDVCDFDCHVGASLRLIRAFGLRRKESIQFRPFQHVLPFEETGLPPEGKAADRYVRIKGKGGRVRWLALDSPAGEAAVAFAQDQAGSLNAHMGDPARDLKRNLRRFDYVLEKFGVTLRERGATGHGLRHEVLIETYQDLTGVTPPVRGGGLVPPEADMAARRAVSALAGHARIRASGAYLGAVLPKLRDPPASKQGTSRPQLPRATD